jgi:phosphonate metabolism-associated iron-containing alcohol dehydrogenase
MKNAAYGNPVKVSFGRGMLGELAGLVSGMKVLLVTTAGARERSLTGRVDRLCAGLVETIYDVAPNPAFDRLRAQYGMTRALDFDMIVAVGGGSVIDTAKVLSVRAGSFENVESMIRDPAGGGAYRLTPVIAVPTTAGTGSEVTPWATVWDFDQGRKYSLHLPDLWPAVCICDPELTISMGRDLTIHSGLDALSHALEAIWNRNRNPVSTSLAVDAVKRIIAALPEAAGSSDKMKPREDMLLGSLQAGLAFSNTQTATAHAVSYHLTARKGIPHGLACSFTLPEIARLVRGIEPDVDIALESCLGEAGGDALDELFGKLGVSTSPSDYGIDASDLREIGNSLDATGRASNSILPATALLDRLIQQLFT